MIMFTRMLFEKELFRAPHQRRLFLNHFLVQQSQNISFRGL